MVDVSATINLPNLLIYLVFAEADQAPVAEVDAYCVGRPFAYRLRNQCACSPNDVIQTACSLDILLRGHWRFDWT